MANIYQAPSGSPSTWVSWEIGACCAVSRRQTDVTIFHIVMARNCVAFVCSFSVFRFSRRLRRLRSAMRRHCSCHRLTLSPFGHLFICEKTKKKMGKKCQQRLAATVLRLVVFFFWFAFLHIYFCGQQFFADCLSDPTESCNASCLAFELWRW